MFGQEKSAAGRDDTGDDLAYQRIKMKKFNANI
jgi:hypothetical protein